jgi:hypothetical protein
MPTDPGYPQDLKNVIPCPFPVTILKRAKTNTNFSYVFWKYFQYWTGDLILYCIYYIYYILQQIQAHTSQSEHSITDTGINNYMSLI